MSAVDQAKNAAEFIEDKTHEARFDELIWMLRQKRDEAALQVPEWEQLRDLASAIKEHTLSNLGHYLEMFEANAQRNGVTVHWARDGHEHNQIVYDILKSKNADTLIARKSAAGYDLTRLFVGSEGTLGVITEATVRLYGIPAAISAAVCSFASIEAAVNAVIHTIQAGVPVARIEVANAIQMDAINKYSRLNLPVAPTLWLEFHGTEVSVAEQAEMVQKIAAAHGGANFSWTTKPEDRWKLWRARHDVVYADKALRPGGQILATDVCVPISRLAECIVATEKDVAASFLPAPIVGHVGDGNFHLVIVLNPNDPREMAEAERLNERLVHRALSLDGTCTGEHGIGSGKIDFLIAEHGEAVSVMRAIKEAIDPDNIMNPGKILRI
jgi:D-lactate dehydrogenase (cytochrome)